MINRLQAASLVPGPALGSCVHLEKDFQPLLPCQEMHQDALASCTQQVRRGRSTHRAQGPCGLRGWRGPSAGAATMGFSLWSPPGPGQPARPCSEQLDTEQGLSCAVPHAEDTGSGVFQAQAKLSRGAEFKRSHGVEALCGLHQNSPRNPTQ